MVPVTTPAATASAAVPSRQNETAACRRDRSSPARTISRASTHGTDADATVPHTSSSEETAPTTAYCRAGSSHTSTAV
jgi:hypothetical protein